MTRRHLNFSPELEARLQVLATQRGTDPNATVLQVLDEVLPRATTATHPDIIARLAAFDSIGTYDTRAQAGLPPVGDTSRNAEPDIYGYSEREDAQL